MLYLLLHWLTGGKGYAHEDPLFRATMAILLAFLIVWALGPRVISALRRFKIGDRAEFDHATLNRMMADKRDTPTMGGILIVIAILVCVLLLGNLQSFYIRMGLFCLVWLALVGGVDDALKLVSARRGSSRDGLKLWEKLMFQVALGALLAIFILRAGQTNAEVARFTDTQMPYEHAYNLFNIPFWKQPIPLPTWIFVILAVIVLAGTSNAVNLTDGMDGLASGCMVMTAFAFMILAYVIGDSNTAKYLLYPPIPGAGELAVMCGAAVGACLGFLWYNSYPAQVFMGDTGSLPLGGLMGYVAIVTRLELMLFIVGGIFVIEGASVLIQIFYYKFTGGGRFFRCAPIHHHFHLGGWSETQVVMRFWLVAALFAAFALATIKLR
ncbi:MAG: phospho-N-acetylmuramoyl-pentapeptide-transferase [Phycisphaerae bacterium]|jgi:phospho-N-acetylmuramoyl-pentapeptide-transferase|nr:phospho-N-acetylmuramoyl-pentapeptide-transferase [Phycisphaerae bacterium]HOO16026.1 phospho-N-acetylmuramoyl-pentapeptide-transferase [Phycisphaerae bacterium]HRS27483.1 phospho-N-acetylmuramoyl-pentapeptide-transferase [Phycisphaerae bacterium]HRT40530.1 phospho-N-acetylmuramoyl-pentapeptide-transferase [Phycisphaerae bacterium]